MPPPDKPPSIWPLYRKVGEHLSDWVTRLPQDITLIVLDRNKKIVATSDLPSMRQRQDNKMISLGFTKLNRPESLEEANEAPNYKLRHYERERFKARGSKIVGVEPDTTAKHEFDYANLPPRLPGENDLQYIARTFPKGSRIVGVEFPKIEVESAIKGDLEKREFDPKILHTRQTIDASSARWSRKEDSLVFTVISYTVDEYGTINQESTREEEIPNKAIEQLIGRDIFLNRFDSDYGAIELVRDNLQLILRLLEYYEEQWAKNLQRLQMSKPEYRSGESYPTVEEEERVRPKYSDKLLSRAKNGPFRLYMWANVLVGTITVGMALFSLMVIGDALRHHGWFTFYLWIATPLLASTFLFPGWWDETKARHLRALRIVLPVLSVLTTVVLVDYIGYTAAPGDWGPFEIPVSHGLQRLLNLCGLVGIVMSWWFPTIALKRRVLLDEVNERFDKRP